MQANKNVWLIGDTFLTDAIAVLGQMQMRDKDNLYMYQMYDIESFYPEKLCTDTFGKIIRSLFYEALEKHNRLPAVIIVVTGNDKIDDMTSTSFHTKRIWNALCIELDRAIKARKNDLPKKAILNEEPRVYFNSVFPRHKDHCEEQGEGIESFKSKRRRLNNLLPQVLKKFDFGVFTITGIIPDNDDYFIGSTGKLNGKGMEAFWTSLSKELRLADELLKERIQNNIIQKYLEQQEEESRIRAEKRNVNRERVSLPKTFPRQDFSRGEGRKDVFQRQHRFGKNNRKRGNSASH